MPWKTWSTNDVLTAADMNAITADPAQADITTAETTTNTTYSALTTAGPSLSRALSAGQRVKVTVSARVDVPNNVTEGFMSFLVSGTGSQAASDANAARAVDPGGTTVTRPTIYVVPTTGTYTFTAQYRTISGGTATFRDRRIIIESG
jgi:hypothetical protein